MIVAYLINQYPQPSHSFIRREIAALEAMSVTVARFTVRRWNQPLIDPRDLAEQARTRVILDAGAVGLIAAVLRTVFSRPGTFLRALRLAWRTGRGSERGILRHLVYLAEACVLLPWLRRCGAQHVHAHFGTNSTAVAMLARELGGPPYSFTAHGPEEFDKPRFIALGEKIHRSAFAVAISQYGKSQLMRWCDYTHWPKLHVVRCGVDELFLNAPATRPPETPHLVSVGRLVPQKGHLLLVDAAHQLAQDGVPFTMTIIGDGLLRPALEQRIARFGLTDRIHLAGWMDNQQVRDQILAARAMVLPSFAEGLPVVLMEAMALHRPVVATRITGIPELVEDSINGWLITPGSVQSLVDALHKVLAATPAQLQDMGCRGAACVAARHNAAVEAARLAEHFTTALHLPE